ncbi:DUF4433 domain-containing protein [Yersinia enterocolitica]|nr:DUF4433 domain-containing protein [Yersinia enterocolitica]ELX2300579.1 DUF4433 domain-containing protein [Yersinia enterocolitica]
MSIPEEYSNRHAYHFTHINNISDMISDGLLANNHPDFPKDKVLSVAQAQIQERRAGMNVSCAPHGVVHDYVPLYFCSVCPMLLAVIKKKNIEQEDIVYLEFPISILSDYPSVFTDASANTNINPTFYSDPKDLVRLPWAAIDDRKWGSDLGDGYINKRMCELLVKDSLPLDAANRIVVWNANNKKLIEEMAADKNITIPPVVIGDCYERTHYYKDYNHHKYNSSSPGPKETLKELNNAIISIQNRTIPNSPKFATIDELLSALRKSLAATPYTGELIGLNSANGVHKKTVDKHTIDVVNNLLSSSGYRELTPRCKVIVELAAYLHDIGKGPKSRWNFSKGLQLVDDRHPIKALSMVVCILNDYVQTVDTWEGDCLVKLICYHDFIGDVLGKGRNKEQLVTFINTADELKMLFALCRADTRSLSVNWWDDIKAGLLYTEMKAICGL